jgi:hypothetical protein
VLCAFKVAEDMKGFSGEPKLGICMRDVYVKGKFDVLNIALATAQDKAMFAKHVGGQLHKLAAQVRTCLPQLRILSSLHCVSMVLTRKHWHVSADIATVMPPPVLTQSPLSSAKKNAK